jgi:hypothetical protein
MSALCAAGVRAIGIYKSCSGLTPAEMEANAPHIFELIKAMLIKAMPIVQQNILKYEVSRRCFSSFDIQSTGCPGSMW